MIRLAPVGVPLEVEEQLPSSIASRCWRCPSKTPLGTQHNLAITPEIVIERKRFGNAELLHDDEAERVAEGIFLVGVTLEQLDGANLVERPHSLDIAESIFDIFQKPERELAAVARTYTDEGVRLPHHGISGDQRPGFPGGPLEERTSCGMVSVFRNEVRKKRAGVREDPLHGFVAESSARYSLLRLEISATSA